MRSFLLVARVFGEQGYPEDSPTNNEEVPASHLPEIVWGGGIV
jgi:hypothetical protein